MAKQYRRPLLTFYLGSPPRRGDRGQDFRVLPQNHSLSQESILDVLIRDVLARQGLLRAALEDEEEAVRLPFVGSVTPRAGVNGLVSTLQAALAISTQQFRATAGVEEAFNLLRERTEKLGVFVMLLGNLGSHHTALSVETFRGFALADSVAPFLVINDQDSRAAWSFTLLHELTHLWLGQTGVSGGAPDREIEQFCNEVASEFLLPNHELDTLGQLLRSSPDKLEEEISEFAGDRKVSRTLVVYRLYRANLIGQVQWEQLRETFRRQWLDRRDSQRDAAREEEGGPSYYVVKRHRVGSALLSTTARLLAAGALSTTKAGQVLGVRPNNVQSLFARATSMPRKS